MYGTYPLILLLNNVVNMSIVLSNHHLSQHILLRVVINKYVMQVKHEFIKDMFTYLQTYL